MTAPSPPIANTTPVQTAAPKASSPRSLAWSTWQQWRQPITLSTIPALCESIALLSTWALISMLPFSRPLIKLLLSITLITTISSVVFRYLLTSTRDWIQYYSKVTSCHVAVFAGGLFLLHLLSLFYSTLPLTLSLHSILKHTEFLYPFLLIPLFRHPLNRRVAINVFLVSLTVYNCLTTLYVFSGLWLLSPIVPVPPTINPIATSVLTAFGFYILAYRLIDRLQAKKVGLRVVVESVLSVFFIYYLAQINHEKVGVLIVIASIGLLLWQTLGKKGLVVALLAVPLSFSVLYVSAPKLRDRMTDLKHNLTAYHQRRHIKSSIGYRLAFIHYSALLIHKRPLTGYGTGSFSYEYAKTKGPVLPGPGKYYNHHKLLRTPHNTYLLIGVELGLVGLVALLAWIGVQMLESTELPSPERYLAQGLTLSLVISSVCFNPLMLKPTACFYSVFISVLFASKLKPNGTRTVAH